MDRSTSTARSPDTRSTGRSSRLTSTSRPESAVRPTETSSGVAESPPAGSASIGTAAASAQTRPPDAEVKGTGAGTGSSSAIVICPSGPQATQLTRAGAPAVAAALRTADTRSARSP